jgi:hypothetical protein
MTHPTEYSWTIRFDGEEYDINAFVALLLQQDPTVKEYLCDCLQEDLHGNL